MGGETARPFRFSFFISLCFFFYPALFDGILMVFQWKRQRALFFSFSFLAFLFPTVIFFYLASANGISIGFQWEKRRAPVCLINHLFLFLSLFLSSFFIWHVAMEFQ